MSSFQKEPDRNIHFFKFYSPFGTETSFFFIERSLKFEIIHKNKLTCAHLIVSDQMKKLIPFLFKLWLYCSNMCGFYIRKNSQKVNLFLQRESVVTMVVLERLHGRISVALILNNNFARCAFKKNKNCKTALAINVATTIAAITRTTNIFIFAVDLVRFSNRVI